MKRWLYLAALLVLPAAARGKSAALSTIAEKSSYLRTGRLDEVVALCPAFARAFPGKAACFEFGRTPEGRPMLALAASADGTLTAAAARERGRPVVLAVAGIHAGEIDGKDAGFWALRELLESKSPGGLGAATLVFVPIFNVDGHERFGPNHRPNQRGPQETGHRRTAQELNLNRDWMKAEAPEMAAMLALGNQWDPAVTIDLHVTDGAKFEHDVAILVSPEEETPRALSAAARTLSATLLARLRAQGHSPVSFYPDFRQEDDPQSGFEAGPFPPRFSNSYFSWRNRLGILVETHSWRPYGHRVRTTRNILLALMEAAVAQGQSWKEAAQAADAEGERLGGSEVPLLYRTEPTPRTIEFRGYAYTRTLSPVSGATFIEYDEKRPQVWRVPLYDRITPAVTVHAPRGGYVVPAAHAAWVARKLDLHGIRHETMRAAPRAKTLVFRADQASFSPASFEGRQTVKLAGAWRPEARDIAAGALFVPVAQPRARLVLQLLEPAAPDSLAAWGFFQSAFERKEGMETYVVEAEARRMLAGDPELRAEFEGLLARDAAFAKTPARRLDFFRRRHPSWDERANLYPVMSVEQRP